MEIEVASGSWRQGLILSVRCGEVRRQAPLLHDTRIFFPQDALAMKQMQVDVFAKLVTDHFVVDPGRELYSLNASGDAEGLSDVALRLRQPEEASGQLRRVLGTDEYVEQGDSRQHTGEVTPGNCRKQSPRAASEPDSSYGENTEERFQKMKQDAASYAERFELRQVLQDMFQRVIKERPENPFEFMQDFISNNNSLRPSAAPSVAPDAEEDHSQRVLELERQLQDHSQRVLELERQLQEARAALAKSASEAQSAVDAISAREQQCRQLLALAELKADSESQRATTLEQRLQDIALFGPSSPSSHSQVAAAHEAAAAREAAMAQQLQAAAAKLQETLSEQLALQRRYSEAEKCRNLLEQKVKDLEAKGDSGDTFTDAASTAAPSSKVSSPSPKASSKSPDSDRESTMTPEVLSRCMDLERRCQEVERERDRLREQLAGAHAAERECSKLRGQLVDLQAVERERDKLRRRLAEAETIAARADSRSELPLTSEQAAVVAEARGRCAELERHLAQSEANMAAQRETSGMLQRRIQELEAEAATPEAAAVERSEPSRSEERQQLNQLRTQIEVLQRRIQAYEAQAHGGGDAAGGNSPKAIQGESGVGGCEKAAKTGGLLSTQRMGAAQVNTHMLSQLMASTYAPPVQVSSYAEPREDVQVEPPPPNPALLIEIVDCKDELSNGIFAWVGTCSSRPIYRLLGPEPRYLYYAEAHIASNWRIVDKMGSEDYIERFRHPSNAKLPVACDKGDNGGRAVEARMTTEVLQKISTIGSKDEKAAIREKFAEVYGKTFVALDCEGRGLISRASPVVAVAHALEAQQRALQLLHGQLSAETQRREASEKHARAMEEAFETLQLKIQAQLPGPPTVASLKEVQAQAQLPGPPSMASLWEVQAQANIGSLSARTGGDLPALSKPPSFLDRGIVLEKDGKVDWAPDSGPGCGPVPHPPMAPKDRRPMPPPTFRMGASSLRNGRDSPRPSLAVLAPLPATPRLPAVGATGPPGVLR